MKIQGDQILQNGRNPKRRLRFLSKKVNWRSTLQGLECQKLYVYKRTRSNFISFYFIDFRKRKGGREQMQGRGRKRLTDFNFFVVPFNYAIIGRFMYMP